MNRFGLVYSDHIWCASWDGFGSLFSGHARVTQFWRLGFAVPCNGHTDNSVRMDWICLATQITQFWWINWNCYCLVTQFLWISWVCYSLVTQTTQFLWIEFVTLWSHKLLSPYGLIEFVTLWSHRLLSPYGLILLLFGHTNYSMLVESTLLRQAIKRKWYDATHAPCELHVTRRIQYLTVWAAGLNCANWPPNLAFNSYPTSR